MEERSKPLIEWGTASRARPGETESGDGHIVKTYPGGALAAVVDGLGHGAEAAEAARMALDILGRYAREPLIPLLDRCHQGLYGTRGVVLSLASFNGADNTMTWLGIGDVAGVLLRHDSESPAPKEWLVRLNGVVGVKVPLVRATMVPVKHGDTLVLATDGVSPGFTGDRALRGPSQQAATHVLARYGLTTDDALVLVARYQGYRP